MCTLPVSQQEVTRKVFWFTLNGVDSKFGHLEFVMMTRLKFSRETDMSDYIMKGKTQLGKKNFLNLKHVSYGDLAKAFKEKAWGNNDDDEVKLVGLHFLHYRLMGSNNRKVISKHIFKAS